MLSKRARVIAWGLFALVFLGSAVYVLYWALNLTTAPTSLEWVDVLGWGVALPLCFSGLGALIISRQPSNRIGWFMMVVALGLNLPIGLILDRVPNPPDTLTIGVWLLVWVDAWSWTPVIFPIFLIPLYFPTGKLSSPRWKWVQYLAIGLFLLFLLISAFLSEVAPYENNWALPNPIGFIPLDFINGPFLIFWGVGLLTTVSASVASLLVRYRHAEGIERQQIKWLLFAGAAFILVYGIIFFTSSAGEFLETVGSSLALVLAILAMAAAIAIAIFRYRLWDLDVVVNRALIYGPLTTVLAGTFAMVITLTTELAKEALGDQSRALGAAISAVIVAVVFQPLRNRIEAFVDKRFYPQKLDLATGLVELEPEYWNFLNRETLVRLTIKHVVRALGTTHASFYLNSGSGEYQQVGMTQGASASAGKITLTPSQQEGLMKKRVVASQGLSQTAGHVPVFIDRGDSIELLGLLSIGKRENGRGYSGDDLKGLVKLGNKVGLALNALRLAETGGSTSAAPGLAFIDTSM